MIEYNAVGGKYNRGLTVVAAIRELAKPNQPDPKTFRIALVVGWCVELVKNSFVTFWGWVLNGRLSFLWGWEQNCSFLGVHFSLLVLLVLNVAISQ